MTRALHTLIAIGISAMGCAGSPYSPPPGPQPIPTPRRAASAALHDRLQRSSSGDVVLDGRDGLAPDEAAIMAVDQNPRLRAVRAERGIARAELVAAGILPNPRIEGSLDLPLPDGEGKVLGYGVGLSWNVTPLLARGARRSAAEESIASVDLEVAWQEWQVAQAARLHALRAIYLERRIRLARELEQTWQQRRDSLRQAQAANAVTALEVANAERACADARLSRLELDRLLVAERAELNRALGLEPDRDIVLDASFTTSATVPRSEELLAALPRRRLDLIALEHAQRSRDQALRAAVIAQFPALEVGLHTSRDVDRVSAAGVTLSIELPFFDRNQAALARERAQRAQVESEYEARLLEAHAAVLDTCKELAIVQEQLAAALEASVAAGKLAEQGRAAAVSGALNPLLAADLLQQSYASRLRALEIEQTLGELRIALALASGTELRLAA